MGSISDAFNHMLECLVDREEKIRELKNILSIIQQHTDVIIFVIDAITGDILYINKPGGTNGLDDTNNQSNTDSSTDKNINDFIKILYEKAKKENKPKTTWEIYSEHHKKWFGVESLYVDWTEDKKAYFNILTDISNQRKKIDTLQFQISIDQMTGLYNQKFAYKVVEKLIREGNEFTVCFIDLDGLKLANDKFGHKVGDNYISKFSQVLRESARKNEYICRMGGDEFLLVFEWADYEDMLNVIFRINNNLRYLNDYRTFPFPISYSYGIVSYDKKLHRDAVSLIKAADEKMYALKKSKKTSRDHK